MAGTNSKGHILIMHDPSDEFLYRHRTEFLEKAGYAVDRVSCPEDAKELILQNTYDLIMTNTRIESQVDGFHLIIWIRKQIEDKHLNTKILAMSIVFSDRENAMKAGADVFSDLSEGVETMLQTIAEMLDSKNVIERTR